MNVRERPADGETRPCPQYRGTLVFSSRYPVLAVRTALRQSGFELGEPPPVRTGVGVPQGRL